MFLLATWIALVGLCIYRALVLSLPFFHEALAQAPLANIFSGAFSDASFGVLMTFLWLLLARVVPEKRRGAAGTAALVFTCIYVYSLAAHIRYVEHFGMNARPYHTAAMANGEMWTVGTMMVLTSVRPWLIIAPMLVMLVVARGAAKKYERHWREKPAKNARIWLAVVFAAVVAFHGGVIQLRVMPGVHTELRYGVYEALYFNYQDYKHVKAVPMPKPDQLAKLRDLLPGPRDYADGEVGRDFPLWQKRISSPPPQDANAAKIRDGLRAYIAKKAQEEGPWNVVLVLSESLRAHEIRSMGDDMPAYANLTPNLDRFAAEGVRFTEVMSIGIRTHFGQTASQCSLNGALDFTILQGAPMSNAVCLSDVFATKGYDTYFFYPADNHFDNQDVFYQKHAVHHIHGEADIPKGSPKAGWGYSDAAMFKHATTTLKEAKQPFFAVMLSLTNHPPLTIPSDVPAGLIHPELPDRLRMLQYVDWTLGDLHGELQENFPHTLMIVIADHGQIWGEEAMLNQIPNYEPLRLIARIPLFIMPLEPDLPADLKGQAIATMASNVDVPPTVLSLLGWGDTPQQFMGMDAFSREGPVYLDWFNKLLRFDAQPNGTKIVTHIDAEREELIGSAGRFNLLMPSLAQ